MVSTTDVTTRSLLDLLTSKGLVNVSSKRFTGVEQAQDREVLLENPPSNDNTVFVALTSVNTQALLDLDLTENVTVDSAGTDLTVNNLTIGEATESQLEIEFGGTYSGGTPHTEDVVPGGAGGPGGSGSLAGTGLGSLTGLTLNAGENILFTATNRSTSSIRFAMKFISTESTDKLVTP